MEIPSFRNVDRHAFESRVLPMGKPAVLRGVAADWPLVRAGLQSAAAAGGYLKTFGPDSPVDYIAGAAAIEGRFFYNEAMTGVNYTRGRAPLGALLEQLIAMSAAAAPAAVSIQALPVRVHLPALAGALPMELVPASAAPRIWIGSAHVIAPHFDLTDNIAVVACGRRRFTLFPPDQLPNLYIGPLEATPQGVPISLVDLRNPDLSRFPRLEQAAAVAEVAVLDPGDALFIPYMWWHGVESLSSFNVLVNYWWNSSQRAEQAPFHALVHAITAIAGLPPAQREVWRGFFDHYVFGRNGDPAGHIPPLIRGVLGDLTPEQVDKRLRGLARMLGGGAGQP